MFLLMPPIRKNLFAIYTKICYDCNRGIQQGVETSVERWLHRRPAKSGSAVLNPAGSVQKNSTAQLHKVPPKWQRRRTVPVNDYRPALHSLFLKRLMPHSSYYNSI